MVLRKTRQNAPGFIVTFYAAAFFKVRCIKWKLIKPGNEAKTTLALDGDERNVPQSSSHVRVTQLIVRNSDKYQRCVLDIARSLKTCFIYHILGPSELKLQISISTDKTVLELKQAIAEKSDVEADRQRLIYSGT